MLDVNLKIIKIDSCGEEYYIVGNNLEEAKEYFLKELNFENVKECDLVIREIQKDEFIEVNISNDSDILLQIINRYRRTTEKVETLNIWDLLIYDIIENKLQKREMTIPYVISGSIFD